MRLESCVARLSDGVGLDLGPHPGSGSCDDNQGKCGHIAGIGCIRGRPRHTSKFSGSMSARCSISRRDRYSVAKCIHLDMPLATQGTTGTVWYPHHGPEVVVRNHSLSMALVRGRVVTIIPPQEFRATEQVEIVQIEIVAL